MKWMLAAVLLVVVTGCGDDANAKACQGIKGTGLDSVAGPLYDNAGPSLQHAIDKVEAADITDLSGQFDIQDLNTLCAKYGVKDAFEQ